jgi:EAL domain-containing protein (putative c-di-GMP-specific phosphodiesterase class I)
MGVVSFVSEETLDDVVARPRVLLVDDEPIVLRALARILSGFDVSTTLDALEAVDLFVDGDFDVVVSDVSMPRLDGLALLARLRSHDPNVPVILLSGAITASQAELATAGGAYRLLEKPFAPGELITLLERAVGLRRFARTRNAMQNAVPLVTLPPPPSLAPESAFDRALARMWMAYQPIVAKNGDTFGWEALLRSDVATLETPLAVLDVAARLGRLHDVGRSVRERAPKALVSMPPDAALCINVHPEELSDPALLAKTCPLLPHADRIVLEVTERAALSDRLGIENVLAELKLRGFRIAVDDLGAGHAGLASFALLEPEIVKLDLDLVRGIDQSDTRQRLAASLIGLCHDLGAVVVAEGVETGAERDQLVELGCDLLQGFLFAHPESSPPAPRW